MKSSKGTYPTQPYQAQTAGHAKPAASSMGLLPSLRLERASSGGAPAKREPNEPHLAKWPFLLGDAVTVTMAYLIYWQSPQPMGLWQVGLAVLCVAGGACLSITPFLLEYWVVARLAETRALTAPVEQLRKLESMTVPTNAAAGQKQSLPEEASEADAAGKGTLQRKGVGVHGGTGFMQPIHDSAKTDLPLEVETLHRLQGDWLQALMQVLDHVYALQLGALRSGQPNLIEQIGTFQDACREAAERIGLSPFIAEPAERFDAQRYQRVEANGPVPAHATVAETITPGYTFHGHLLRPALVRLVKSAGDENAEAQTEGKKPQLALEAKKHA